MNESMNSFIDFGEFEIHSLIFIHWFERAAGFSKIKDFLSLRRRARREYSSENQEKSRLRRARIDNEYTMSLEWITNIQYPQTPGSVSRSNTDSQMPPQPNM